MQSSSTQSKRDFFWMQGDKVWVYTSEKNEKVYPKSLQDEFPGIPFPLDAAVECHRGECQDEGILFFQGQSRLESEYLQ